MTPRSPVRSHGPSGAAGAGSTSLASKTCAVCFGFCQYPIVTWSPCTQISPTTPGGFSTMVSGLTIRTDDGSGEP
ncbi:Uncharacterised protein [Mycobacterium tuberculosis]|nr:Uncharacterised protein [Mycobacterium tuberculosis]